MNHQKNVPQGKFARSGILGVAATKVGVKQATHVGKRPFIPEQRKHDADLENEKQIAKIIFDALCTLRGTALKAAQLISMELELLPETYRRELAKAASEVTPMNRALVRKVIKNELGIPEKVFADFSITPFAAASLGQVHAATSHDGKKLAVKVQYPGIAAGVESDLSMLQTLLKPTRYSRIFAACFTEVLRKVSQELDYEIEAINTEWFRHHFCDERFVIPEVLPELSTKTVLSTTRVEGLHLEEWLATAPSQKNRDRYGQLLVDFFNQCLYGNAVLHADPNPGNFLFRPDGRLGIVDFGCIKRFNSEFVQSIGLLCRHGGPKSGELLEGLYRKIGVVFDSSADRQELVTFLSHWIECLMTPYRQDQFDFSKADAYFAQGMGQIRDLYRFVDRYEGSFTYFGRTEYGLMRLLQRLGARVRMHSNELYTL